jgi:hypothetical protein
MKLLVILSIEEYAAEVRKILAHQKVSMYSETEIYGFRAEAHQPDIANWFAKDTPGVYSRMFFSIQSAECVTRILDEVESYNSESGNDQPNPLHAYQLNVEKSV